MTLKPCILWLSCTISLLIMGGCGDGTPVVQPSGTIKILSNRADLISGGDALIEVVLPAGAKADDLKIRLNGRDITSQFGVRENGRYMGLLEGLKIGSNTVTSQLPGRIPSSYQVVNHPSGGPVFSGPQPQPWVCQAGAINAQCDQAPVYTFVYMSSLLPGQMLPYDPDSPPLGIANTTTDQGVTVPFIVRVETGYLNRDQYTIKTLFQPDMPWTAWAPQPQWNHKLLITHGSGCGSERVTAEAPADETSPRATWITAVGRGFAVMSHALNNASHNCNIATQAEALMMTKERLVEQYGELRYTIGTGTSGGSLTQQQVSNAYPGIYQGTIVTASFQDAWSNATQVSDYHLLNSYFNDPTKWGLGVLWLPTQMAQVEGHLAVVNSVLADQILFNGVLKPDNPCAGVSPGELYGASANPGGVRCSLQDYMINVFGPRSSESWDAQELAIGRGFGSSPLDNVGVQYGLQSLKQGQISVAQFLDLNQKIGGLSIDAVATPSRMRADSVALANAYRSGAINQATHSNQVAVINGLGPDPGIIHDTYRALSMRARINRAHASHDNYLIWGGPVVGFGDAFFLENAFFAMDRWLSAVELDTSNRPISEKIVVNKPSDLGDRCYNGLGVKISDGLCPDAVVPVYGTPRTVAGDALTTDTNKCQLMPLDRASYGNVTFTEAQWAQMQALFPSGVCDFSKPGVGQQPTIPWQTYQTKTGAVIYGGKALSSAPRRSGSGWAGPAFRVFDAP